ANVGGSYYVTGPTNAYNIATKLAGLRSPYLLSLTGSGGVGGDGILTASGLTTLSSGYMNNAGTTNANGGLTINGFVHLLDSRVRSEERRVGKECSCRLVPYT